MTTYVYNEHDENQVLTIRNKLKKKKRKRRINFVLIVLFLIFLVIFLFHLVSRQWPYGDMFQTVLDVLLGITAILIVVKYFVVKNKA